MSVEELMKKLPATCGPDDTLREAEQKMQNSNCAFLPVTAGGESRFLLGVITEGDISMASELRGRSLEEIRVKDAMAEQVYICNPEDSLVEAELIMRRAAIRRLPVVDASGRLLGVISLADIEHATEFEALSAQISAACFNSAASRIHAPHGARRSMRVAGAAHALESSGER